MTDEDIHVFVRTKIAYEKLWKSVDNELYELCERRDNHSFVDVYTKVSIINRVYSAGLSRIRGGHGERDVAQVLVDNSQIFQEQLGRLGIDGRFDKEMATKAIEAHGEISALMYATTGTWPVSFVSKYLHFHRRSVPIYDSQVVKSINRWVPQSRLSAAQKALPRPSTTHDRNYYKYVCRFVTLFEQLQSRELGTSLTVKGLDTMLWDPVAPNPGA